MNRLYCLGILVACWMHFVAALPAEDNMVISPARSTENGFLEHAVTSPYQAGTTHVRVLLPDGIKPEQKRSVLYILPVEAGYQSVYGDGLKEAKLADLHNKYGLVCVAPTFSHLPWYADHPTDAAIRQETYLLKVVVPFVDRSYPVVAERQGRLLVGFSKSGWGAFSLLLRNTDVFDKAAAWDAPLMMSAPNKYGMQPIFGTQENFEPYRLTALLKSQAEHFQQRKRLLLTGAANFRDHHEQAHALMTELRISHVYQDGPPRKHHWDSGWLAEAVAALMKNRD